MQRYLVVLLLWLMLPLGACRSGGIEINVHYDRISGLTMDDRVMMKGGRVGVVESIQYTRDGTYLVQLSVDKAFANALTEHAQFIVVDDPDRDGDKAVEIRHSQSGGRLLAGGESVDGAYDTFGLSRQLQKEIESGVLFFKQTLDQVGRDIQGLAASKEFREMKRSLEGLVEEMGRKEKAVRESFKRQWLPRIQRELDDLREKLKQLGRETEMAPLDEQVERLRRI